MTRRSAILLATLSPLAAGAAARHEEKRISPHETVSIDLNGGKISISYGRPYLKGRHLGDPMAPYGEVWRLGADEATKLTLTARTGIRNAFALAPGSYALFAILHPDRWTMIVNKVANQWGAFSYSQAQDVGRFDLPVKHLSQPIEQFTISLDKAAPNVARVTFAWDRASVSTDLKLL
ncbi:MAG: DUF2911 domain-containing protein [Bryobacteraceae bacterium]